MRFIEWCYFWRPQMNHKYRNYLSFYVLRRFRWTKTHNFGQILTFGGSCTDPLLPIRVKFSALEQTHCIRLHAKFRLHRFILSTYGGEKLPFFGLRNFAVSPVGSSLRKFNTSRQPQTFPYSTASKSFMYSNGFMAKSGAQTLTFKSVTNRPDKKLNVFGHPGGG